MLDSHNLACTSLTFTTNNISSLGFAFSRSTLVIANVILMQLDEWWEQPASTLVDWVTVDDISVVAWQNHVKQLLAAYDKELF